MKPYILLTVLFLFGCGVEVYELPEEGAETGSEVTADKAPEAAPEVSEDAQEALLEEVLLKGYVASAFEVEVDGEVYSDSEDFYTKELDRIQITAQEAGYDGYKMSFDAQIGLNDLKYDMRVYVIGSDRSRGYAGETKVRSDGTFVLNVPTGSYTVRANKRIGVTLRKDKEVVKWCYNFSGIEREIDLFEDDRPVLINSFVTKLTKYACEADASGGIVIPGNPNATSGVHSDEVTK